MPETELGLATHAEPALTTNRTAVLFGAGKLRIEDRPIPTAPGAGQVLVNIVVSGICGSDLSRYKAGNHAFEGKPAPSDGSDGETVPGHESAGSIVKIGPDVRGLHVGQRVMLLPSEPCFTCFLCCQGKHNLCRNAANRSMLNQADGFLQQYVTVLARCALPLPDNISWDEAACIQPLAIAIHVCDLLSLYEQLQSVNDAWLTEPLQAARRAGIRPHQNVAVIGAGPVGLFLLEVLKAYNTSTRVVLDISEDRLAAAQRTAATLTIKRDVDAPGGFEATMRESTTVIESAGLTSRFGFDVVFEATAAPSCMMLGAMLTRPGGTYVQVGLGGREVSMPMRLITVKEINMLGIIRYSAGCFEDAIDLIQRKQVDLLPYVDKRMPLTQTEAAILELKTGNTVKIAIYNNAE